MTGGDDLFDLVRDAVVDAGAGIRRLQPRTVSLEDVFLGVEVSANAQMTAEPLPRARKSRPLAPSIPPAEPITLSRDGAEARILDRGYRRYEGERRGVGASVRSLVIHSVQRAFGLRRTVWAKILPALAVAIAYVPAIVFVGLVALFGTRRITTTDSPTYGQYYGYIVSAIIVFVAFVAPEVLCTDRRTGMLGIYLAVAADPRHLPRGQGLRHRHDARAPSASALRC